MILEIDKGRALRFICRQMFNLTEFDRLNAERERANRDLEAATDYVDEVETLKRKILSRGLLSIAAAFGVSAVLSYPGVCEFGEFSYVIVVCAASFFFMFFQLVFNGKSAQAKKRFEEAEERRRVAVEKSLDYISSCLLK